MTREEIDAIVREWAEWFGVSFSAGAGEALVRKLDTAFSAEKPAAPVAAPAVERSCQTCLWQGRKALQGPHIVAPCVSCDLNHSRWADSGAFDGCY